MVSKQTDIEALSLQDGTLQWEIDEYEIWSHSISSRAVYATVYQDSIYLGDLDKTHLVDAASGEIEETREFDFYGLQLEGDLLLDINAVYDADTFDYKFALQPPRRESLLGPCDELNLPYAVFKDTLYGAAECGGIYAMSLRNGKIKWEYLPHQEGWPSPAVLHDHVYALLDNGQIHAIALEDGTNQGILATNAPLPDYTVNAPLTSVGITSNGEVLVVTFNEPTVLGLGIAAQ